MTELTIFTAPKPFTHPHINVIQRNAIRSWLALGDAVNVLVLGDEPGIEDAAKELGATHIPTITRNEQGTPLLSDIFAQAYNHSTTPLLAYANADIILMPDFVEAAHTLAAQSNEFLAVGRRWNLDITELLALKPGWDAALRDRTKREGELYTPNGIDYFLYPRHLFHTIPAFAVGRPGWDNWMIYTAHAQDYHLVDLTETITIVHQNHDYHHLDGQKTHHNTEEGQTNIALAGGSRHMYNILDAKHKLSSDGRIRPIPLNRIRAVRALERRIRTNSDTGLRWYLASRLRRLQKRWKFQ